MKDKDKIIDILDELTLMALCGDVAKDDSSKFADRILAIQEEEAKERYEEAAGILKHHNITFRTWDVPNKRRITQDTVLLIAAGLEPTK